MQEYVNKHMVRDFQKLINTVKLKKLQIKILLKLEGITARQLMVTSWTFSKY